MVPPSLRLPYDRLLRFLGLRRPVALIVEGDEDQAAILSVLLRDAGFSVYVAFDGVTGLNKAFALAPDLIVLDFQMPELDGLRFLRVLRSAPGGWDPKVIFETSADDVEEDALAVGADVFLAKPFDVREMLAAAHRLAR